MFGNPVDGAGSYAGYATPQGHPKNRSRSKSLSSRIASQGQTEGQEERFVEGDLFGSTKRQSLRSADPPAGQPPRLAYYEGAGLNAFSNGNTTGIYGQHPTAQASPFAHRPTQSNMYMPAGRFSTGGTGVSFGGGYNHADGGNMVDAQREVNSSAGNNRALVPLDSNGGADERSAIDRDDDDGMPTRSLADADNFTVGGVTSGGLRHRYGGEDKVVGGRTSGLERDEEPDMQKATWIVVWGVPPGKANDVLIRFLQFGDIKEQRGTPGSNWLYFKYSTRLQADKALSAGHSCRLTDTVMLGVQKVTDDKVWWALREGRIPLHDAAAPLLCTSTPGRNAMRARTPNSSRTNRNAIEIEDSDLVGAPPQSPGNLRNVCNRVMAWFGFY